MRNTSKLSKIIYIFIFIVIISLTHVDAARREYIGRAADGDELHATAVYDANNYDRLIDADQTWRIGDNDGLNTPLGFDFELAEECGGVNCTAHQTCDEKKMECVCAPGWAPPYCDWPLTTLTGKHPTANGTVAGKERHYFIIDIPDGSGRLVWQADVAAKSLQMYVRFNEPPTPNDYDYQNVAGGLHQVIDLSLPTIGNWYALLYNSGGEAAAFNMSALASVVCQNDCSGHGQCEKSKCTCEEGYSLPDCAVGLFALTAGTKSGEHSSPKGGFIYFYLDTTQGNLLSYTIQLNWQQGEGGSSLPRAYLRALALPTELQYNALQDLNVSVPNAVSMLEPPVGRQYLGILPPPDAAVTVQVTATIGDRCPNDCSGHGSCVADNTESTEFACECDAAWTFNSVDCSVYVQFITDDAPVVATDIKKNEWRFFVLPVASEANYLVFQANVTQKSSNETEEVAFYVSRPPPESNDDGQLFVMPNQFQYWHRSPPGSADNQLIAQGINVVAGMWTMGLRGVSAEPVTVTVTGSTLSLCPRDCSHNGQCERSGEGRRCRCNAGFVSDDCSSTVFTLKPAVVYRGSVSFNAWQYYLVTVLGENAFHLSVNETHVRGPLQLGLIEVYARKVEPSCMATHCIPLPADQDYQYKNASETSEHTIVIPSGKANGTWVIGITGSAAESGLLEATYAIVGRVGCTEYRQCSLCVQDPNCGWCAADARSGDCVSGSVDGPATGANTCADVWRFDTCSVDGPRSQSTTLGIAIGVIVGLVVVMSIIAAFVFYWWREVYKRDRAHVHFAVEAVADDDDDEEEGGDGGDEAERRRIQRRIRETLSADESLAKSPPSRMFFDEGDAFGEVVHVHGGGAAASNAMQSMDGSEAADGGAFFTTSTDADAQSVDKLSRSSRTPRMPAHLSFGSRSNADRDDLNERGFGELF